MFAVAADTPFIFGWKSQMFNQGMESLYKCLKVKQLRQLMKSIITEMHESEKGERVKVSNTLNMKSAWGRLHEFLIADFWALWIQKPRCFRECSKEEATVKIYEGRR